MCFKVFVVLNILIISFVAADDYKYNNPNQNSQHETSTQLNNVANDINAFSAATSHDDSEATPIGYDYTPKTVVSHATTPNYVQVEQQRFAVASPAEYWPPAKYEYNYGVNDAYTGDIKSHTESRDGNFVRGSYSVVDPDGFERIVTYTVDDFSGFNAVVNRKPYVSNLFKSAPAVELHQTDKQLTPTLEYHNAETQSTVRNNEENNYIDSTVESHDSYATQPSSEHQNNNNGPYH